MSLSRRARELFPFLLLVLVLAAKTLDGQATTGPSPYLVAPSPPTSTFTSGDLSSTQPFWRDPRTIPYPFPAAVREGSDRGPRQGVSPPAPANGTSPSPSPNDNNGTSPSNATLPLLTLGPQYTLPAAAPLSADPFSVLALDVATAFLPPVLAAKAAGVANAAAAKLVAKKSPRKISHFCPLSPADRDLLRTVTGSALGAAASSIASSASALEVARCAISVKSTRPSLFQWVVQAKDKINPCELIFSDVAAALTQAIVAGKCFVPPASGGSSAAAVAAGGGGGAGRRRN